MSKWEDFKKAIANPPPERMARIEYQSHFLNILGVLFVSTILIFKGYWYIIFAFIFSVGVGYSQGMTAYAKYKMIKEVTSEIPIELDKSPLRKRFRTVKVALGIPGATSVYLIAMFLSSLIINPFTATWYQRIAFVFLLILIYLVLNFFVFYYLALLVLKKRVKGGVKDGSKKNSTETRRRKTRI